MFKTHNYKKKELGFCDLLNYGALVDDGIILNKDGSLMAGFKFAGNDVSSSTIEERNSLMNRMNNVLCSFGTGWMMHVEAIRSKEPNYLNTENASFDHPVFMMIDEERKNYYQKISSRFDSDYYIFLTYMPPHKVTSKIESFMFETKATIKGGYNKHVDDFKMKIREALSNLKNYFSIDLLGSYLHEDNHYYCTLLEALNHIISGKPQRIKLPFCPIGLDTQLSNHEFWSGLNPKLDDELISTLTINDFPDSSKPNMLYHLDKIGIEYRWSSRFVFFDKIDAEKALTKEQKKWKQKIVSFKDVLFNTKNPKIDADAKEMFSQYDQAIKAIKSNGIQFGHYTSTIILRAKTQSDLEDKIEIISNAIKHLGFNSKRETVNCVEAFFSSFPSDSLHNVRRPLINTLNLSGMLPISAQWTGMLENPCDLYPKNSPAIMQCSGEGNAPFRLNLHQLKSPFSE